jgi:hypothetical protein
VICFFKSGCYYPLCGDSIIGQSQVFCWFCTSIASIANGHLGVGVLITKPSLGMMIASGKNYICAGNWWLKSACLFQTVIIAFACISLSDPLTIRLVARGASQGGVMQNASTVIRPRPSRFQPAASSPPGDARSWVTRTKLQVAVVRHYSQCTPQTCGHMEA